MSTVYEVNLTPQPQEFNVEFPNGQTYSLRLMFLYDAETPTWTIDFSDANANLIVAGVPLVTGCDLFEQYAYLGFGCAMFCTTDGDTMATPTFLNLGSTAHLWIETTP